jgi:hypothetical protein
MKKQDEITTDAVAVMKSGGQQVADDAISKWWSGKYGDNAAQIKQRVEHWRRVRERVAELCLQLKAGK